MALREFDGPGGLRWKAWDVTAGQIHPKTRAEDYMRDLAEGWIVFERVDGEEKRRLCPYPDDWQGLPDPEIAALCAKAEIVKKRLTPPLGGWKIGDAPVAPQHNGHPDGLHDGHDGGHHAGQPSRRDER